MKAPALCFSVDLLTVSGERVMTGQPQAYRQLRAAKGAPQA